VRLKPEEILKCLGLVVPAEGLEIDAKEAPIHIAALTLLGRTLRMRAIPDRELMGLSVGIAVLYDKWCGRPVEELTRDVDLLRTSIEKLLIDNYFLGPEAIRRPIQEQPQG
jgi:hypothetical protein